jgi:hypothetical protein
MEVPRLVALVTSRFACSLIFWWFAGQSDYWFWCLPFWCSQVQLSSQGTKWNVNFGDISGFCGFDSDRAHRPGRYLIKGSADSKGCSNNSLFRIWNQRSMLVAEAQWVWNSHHVDPVAWGGRGQLIGWPVGDWCCGKKHRAACTCLNIWFSTFV